MKKIKIFFVALLSLLLPSCTNTPSSSQENNSVISGDAEKLNENLNEVPPDSSDSIQTVPIQYSTPVKFPASNGGSSSGDGNTTSKTILENINNSEDKPLEAEFNSDIEPSRELLGSYSTKVYTKTQDRQKNLKIVCEKLSGTILAPNQEFSYNETCGPYNKENGFGKATVFVGNGIEKQDYGGGVCQLSSTLYNAVKDLNVEITERHLHSKKVYYVPDGQDATVSYGNLDFKFKNNNDYSLYFESNSNAETVNVYVYKV